MCSEGTWDLESIHSLHFFAVYDRFEELYYLHVRSAPLARSVFKVGHFDGVVVAVAVAIEVVVDTTQAIAFVAAEIDVESIGNQQRLCFVSRQAL